MAQYLIRRVLLSIPTAFLVATIVFSLVHLVPGNPAVVILGVQASPSDVKMLDQQLHLNLPIWQQYLDWLGQLIQGNLGTSMIYQVPVLQLIFQSLPRTIELSLVAMALSILIGVPAGLFAGFYHGRLWDRISLYLATVGVVLPGFVIALLLIYVFTYRLHWLQIAGIAHTGTAVWISPLAYLVPGLTLAFGLSGPLMRILRTEVRAVAMSDHIRTMRMMGSSEGRIMWKWTFKNALIPMITFLGTQLGLLMGGVVIIENIFSIPGMGNLLVTGIFNKDYPVVQGCVLAMAFMVIVVNLLVELVYAVIDPRISYR
ncbi:MAG: ABC transporter permease [Firmicutes bacterium]|nr:ABC transporter permease [Bacillota bacterium]